MVRMLRRGYSSAVGMAPSSSGPTRAEPFLQPIDQVRGRQPCTASGEPAPATTGVGSLNWQPWVVAGTKPGCQQLWPLPLLTSSCTTLTGSVGPAVRAPLPSCGSRLASTPWLPNRNDCRCLQSRRSAQTLLRHASKASVLSLTAAWSIPEAAERPGCGLLWRCGKAERSTLRPGTTSTAGSPSLRELGSVCGYRRSGARCNGSGLGPMRTTRTVVVGHSSACTKATSSTTR
mmetsp:Transcript_9961/g.28294  ORF Transcript_9961/g.28294 Transcript_9961/m.28294 type:complete len:232 (+) Transcript_9961:1261-1956(+)